MSSAPDFSLLVLQLQQNNCLSLVFLVCAGYDYILVFPKEVQYIWSKPWSWVSTLYIIVRYCGLLSFAICSLRQIFSDIGLWINVFFFCAADFVMILRVWAMYNRSRPIFGILVSLFSIEVIMLVASCVNNVRNPSWVTVQVLKYSFCAGDFESPTWDGLSDIFQMVFATVLCMFVLFQYARQSLQMYHVMKKWRLNQYVNLLVQQGVLYYFAILLLGLVNVLFLTGNVPGTGWQFILAAIVEQIPAFTLTPRFIISIREMYEHDLQGRRGGGIDSGFGLSTVSSHHGVAGEQMVFATGAQSEDAGNVGGHIETANLEADDGQNVSRGDIEEVPREVARSA